VNEKKGTMVRAKNTLIKLMRMLDTAYKNLKNSNEKRWGMRNVQSSAVYTVHHKS